MPLPIRLEVDASDTDHAIFRVVEFIPLVAGAPVVLTIAKWLPAYHAPEGAISFLAGFEFHVDGEICSWVRDPADPYRLIITVPDGATELRAVFQGLTPTEPSQGRVVVSDDMLRLDWAAVCLYPVPANVDVLLVEPTLRVPPGWAWATSLAAVATDGDRVTFGLTDIRRLLDSPILAGRHVHTEALDPTINLTIVSDREDQLPQNAAVLDAHKRLIAEADALFGARPFAHYDFLMTLSDQIGGMGLEHWASSECGVRATYFSNWETSTTEHDLLPHEYTHSWIGKYRVPLGNFGPDFSIMTDELMWVYEGLTQFYGHVLAARSGLISPAHTLEAFALIFTTYDGRPGRLWRPLGDTDMDPIFSSRRPQPWTSWQRSEDYYSEGLLIWLEVDAILREETKGAYSLDDFCRAFFAPPPDAGPDPAPKPYRRDELIAVLSTFYPFAWEEYFASRVDRITLHAPYRGIALGGYELAWQTFPSDWLSHDQLHFQYFDFSYSLGMTVGIGAQLLSVTWDGPAFRAGLSRGMEIIAVADRAYSVAAVQDAIDLAQQDGKAIELTVRRFDRVKRVLIEWTGGQRYPTLRATGAGPRHLDSLLAPRLLPAETISV
ncbi:MAG: peptidase M61 [Pseudomonadota bacterium]|nr:peptidase M61 [Pseudomonadota bacterium]